MSEDFVTIVPVAGEESETGKKLIELADDPRDVRTSTDTASGTGYVAFIVPAYLGDKYVGVRSKSDEETETDASSEKSEDDKVSEKRGPGRPRKNSETSDQE